MIFFTTGLLAFLMISASFAIGIEEKICASMEIREFNQLNELTNCTVIDGNLIVIFPFSFESLSIEVQNKSFPLLREVTGFVLLHIHNHLKTLYKLFPNLTIIRGNQLFSKYALVIYDCKDLEEITLRNLLQISRGSVKIENNVNLCFPRKIDFDQIIMDGSIYLSDEVSERSLCKIDDNFCYTCPSPDKCWHNGACQRFQSSYYVQNLTSKTKCHELCLGACIDGTNYGCYVCKDLRENNVCVKSCSKEMYLYSDSRRCITGKQCSQLNRKIYNKECLSECPTNYYEQVDEVSQVTLCIPCITKCPKYCTFPVISSISDLEMIGSGCTIINGSLEINIIEDVQNLTFTLQKYLGDIEEINGTLKIHRSTSLTSLTFLNNLKRVHGLKNETNNFAINIFQNVNLQSIFDKRLRNGTKLEVKLGNIMIYENILLCKSEINDFLALIEPNYMGSKDKYLINDNGNQTVCKNEYIKTNYRLLSHDQCEIIWEDSEVIENFEVKAYILEYTIIDDSQITELDENVLYKPELCSNDEWIKIILKEENYSKNISADSKVYTYLFTNLTQFTTYAFRIQPYFNSLEDRKKNVILNGPSEIKRFRTMMNIPSRVLNVATNFKTSTSLLLEWNVVDKEKSVIQQFFIYIYELSDSLDLLDKTDYCEFASKTLDENERCDECCENELQKKKIDEKNELDFKNFLIDFTQDDGRYRNRESHRDKMASLPNFIRKVHVDGKQRTLNVDNLKVFTFYSFHIYACTHDRKCSDYEMHTDKTAINENFDAIEDLVFSTNEFELGTFRVYFEEPKEKNGAIIYFLIEIRKKLENEAIPFKTDCITRKYHELNKYYYATKDLPEGNYTIRVAAVSFAQHGKFTNWHLFKIVHPKEHSSIGLTMLLSLIFLAILFCVASILYYYKQKIMTIFSRQNDTLHLMNEMEQTD